MEILGYSNVRLNKEKQIKIKRNLKNTKYCIWEVKYSIIKHTVITYFISIRYIQ